MIVGLDGTPVSGVDDLHRRLIEKRIGVTATLTLVRGPQLLEVRVTPRDG